MGPKPARAQRGYSRSDSNDASVSTLASFVIEDGRAGPATG
jgi:hypothetical protein